MAKASTAAILPIALITSVLASATLAKPNQQERQVLQKFQAAFDGQCDSILTGDDITNVTPAVYEMSFRYDYEEESDPAHTFRVYEFPCYAGAYNRSYIYYGASEYDDIRQIYFAFPTYDISYKDEHDTIVDTVTLTGFSAWESLTNPSYEAATQSFLSHSAWRGLGDASSSGRWEFDKDRFVLKTYDIDPTYDGELNQFRIYGEGQPQNQN